MGHKKVNFEPKKDIPNLEGKVILVTGGNIGLGKQSILELARHKPAEIWLAARSLDKAKAAADEVKKEVPSAPIKLVEMDLASLASVKQAAQKFLEQSDRLDILLLNAGVMALPPGLTKDGYEIQFGTNHLGHALLFKKLLPVLERTAATGADVRIVSLTSTAHDQAPKEGVLFSSIKTTQDDLAAYTRYGQSKVSNIYFARELAKHYPQFTSVSVHPGIVQTNLNAGAKGAPLALRLLVSSMNFVGVRVPVEEGVKNQLWASVARDVKSGEYYEPVGISGKGTATAKNETLSKKLWDWTEKELESYL